MNTLILCMFLFATPVIIPYERAVELAQSDLLAVIDTAAQIRETETLLAELRGDNTEWDNLFELNMQIQSVIGTQTQLAQVTEDAFENILHGLTFITYEDAPSFLAESFHQAIQSMILSHEINNSIAMLEMHRLNILNNIGESNDERKSELEHRIELLNLNKEHIKNERENVLKNAILLGQEIAQSIESAHAEIYLLEENLRRTKNRHEFGRASISDIRTAEHALAQARITLSSLKINQYSIRQSLNHILGQPLSQYTVIEFTPGDVPNINIPQTIAATPLMRQLQLEVERTRNLKQDEDEELRKAYERAVLGRNHANAEMEVALRRGLNDMENLATQKNAWQIELNYANATLETALAHLELGRVTPHEVDLVRFNILKIEQSINTIANKKWHLAFLLKNPSFLGV